MSVRSAAWLACVVAFALGGRVLAAQGFGPASTLSLHVELVEQASCALPSGEFMLMFELRTIYVNRGSAPVTLALSTERVAGMAVTPVSARPPGVVHVAGPPGPTSSFPGAVAVARPGWAQTGSVRAEVKVSGQNRTEGDALAPGEYGVQFEVEVLGHAGRGAFAPIRLSTAAVPVTIESPGQVQECGSASLRATDR